MRTIRLETPDGKLAGNFVIQGTTPTPEEVSAMRSIIQRARGGTQGPPIANPAPPEAPPAPAQAAPQERSAFQEAIPFLFPPLLAQRAVEDVGEIIDRTGVGQRFRPSAGDARSAGIGAGAATGASARCEYLS